MPRFRSAVGVMSRSSRGNRAIAFTVSKVILAGWVVFKTFIEVPKGLEKGLPHNQPFQFLFMIEDKRQQLCHLFRSINAGQDGGGNQESLEQDQETGSCGLFSSFSSRRQYTGGGSSEGGTSSRNSPGRAPKIARHFLRSNDPIVGQPVTTDTRSKDTQSGI